MKATENVDAVYLTTLLGELGQISDELDAAGMWSQHNRAMGAVAEARTRLDQLRVRIGNDIREMQAQEATDDSEMPLGPIAAREQYTNG